MFVYLIIGLVLGVLAAAFALGLCRASAEADRQAACELLELLRRREIRNNQSGTSVE
jgi:hypothetical protein